MKTLVLAASMMMAAMAVNAQDKLTADVSKSKLVWLGEKVTGEHTGNILLKSGSLVLKDNKIVSGEFSIDMTSISNTDITDAGTNAMLVGHLKSDDFFGVEKFPTASIVITGSTSFAKGTAEVKANLTIKGKTNPITFKVTKNKTDEGTWFYTNLMIDRSKYDVRFGSGSFFDDLGDKLIYDEFKLKVNLLVK